MQFAFEFWAAMATLFGARWIAKHGDAPSGEWQRLLARFAGMDPQALVARIAKQLKPNDRGEVWPPEMADVIAMCQPTPEEFGLPTVNEAYRDATHSRWTRHAVVYEAARRVGTFELRTVAEAKSRPAFEREYAEVCAEWMAGARFEAPKAPRLEQRKSSREGNQEAYQQHLAARRQILGGE